MTIEFLIAHAIGLVLGSIITNLIFYIRYASGTLKIDHTNPEKDVYRFEIDDLDKIVNRKNIVLRIDNNADLSQD